jgi:hypothetical protein
MQRTASSTAGSTRSFGNGELGMARKHAPPPQNSGCRSLIPWGVPIEPVRPLASGCEDGGSLTSQHWRAAEDYTHTEAFSGGCIE